MNTPDEEIGVGTDFIQMKRMGEFAYTMDGGMMGEIEQECFDAWGTVWTWFSMVAIFIPGMPKTK